MGKLMITIAKVTAKLFGEGKQGQNNNNNNNKDNWKKEKRHQIMKYAEKTYTM